MKEGDVVLAPLPQGDGETKPRPVLVLRIMPPFGDLLVCGISTQLHQAVANFDELIRPTDTDFASSGLVSTSLFRLGFLAALPTRRVLGRLGSVSTARQARLLRRLADYLVKDLGPVPSKT